VKSSYHVEIVGIEERNGFQGYAYHIEGNGCPPLRGWIKGTKKQAEQSLSKIIHNINKRHSHEGEAVWQLRRSKL